MMANLKLHDIYSTSNLMPIFYRINLTTVLSLFMAYLNWQPCLYICSIFIRRRQTNCHTLTYMDRGLKGLFASYTKIYLKTLNILLKGWCMRFEVEHISNENLDIMFKFLDNLFLNDLGPFN